MGARHSKKRKRAVESDGASGSVAPNQETSAQRVMSISPTDIDLDAEPMTIDHGDVLLTPRVLDQNAFDQLSQPTVAERPAIAARALSGAPDRPHRPSQNRSR